MGAKSRTKRKSWLFKNISEARGPGVYSPGNRNLCKELTVGTTPPLVAPYRVSAHTAFYACTIQLRMGWVTHDDYLPVRVLQSKSHIHPQ